LDIDLLDDVNSTKEKKEKKAEKWERGGSGGLWTTDMTWMMRVLQYWGMD